MKSYAVTFTFGGCVVVEAKNAADAESIVEDMDTGELLMLAEDGFEIQGVETA